MTRSPRYIPNITLPDPHLEPCYSLLPSKRRLRLHGNSHNLSSPESPALLPRKQTAFRQKWKVLLDFKPTKPGSEAGVVVWLNRYSYCSLGIHVGEEGHRVVSMTRPDDDGEMGREMVQVRYLFTLYVTLLRRGIQDRTR